MSLAVAEPRRSSGDRDLAAAYARCRRIARGHYENFTVGSWLLPRRFRDDLAAIYAFARGGDDLADEGPAAGRVDRLAAYAAELERSAADPEAAGDPVFLALGHTIRTRGLPVESLRDLLEAFRRDAAGETARFATFEDVHAYCRRSANPVGRLVLALFGYRDPERQARSDDVCTALQLTNFWQDVAGDFAGGRVYLPDEDLDRFPGSRDALRAGRVRPPFERLLAFEVERTRALFARGVALADTVVPRLAREVRIFSRGGLAILARIEAVRYDVFARRPTLGRGDVARIVLGALLA